MPNKLSILIPAFNEEKTIEAVLEKVAAQDFGGWSKEIIVVDDGSTDSSKIKIQNSKLQFKIQNLRLIVHDKNRGKGAAIRTGVKEADGDAVIVQDADLEYDPADIKRLLDELDHGASVVFGSRELQPERRGYWHDVLGVRFLTWLVNLFFGSKLTDVYTCYKLFRAEVIKGINIESRGFELEMELTVKTLKMGYRIKEVPIHYYPRKFSEGKKIRAQDGLKGIWTLLKNRF
ncbi:MAG: glycosyltransferase family 2 protein [Parcubacteria group bacterium]|nr:glycosyltransferase family 2 protein [Parcubacteria group bacterium]